jgi:hypothetical protein
MSFEHIDSKKFNSLDEYLAKKRESHLKHLEKQIKEINNLNISGNIEDIELDVGEDVAQERDVIIHILENRTKYQNIDNELPISNDIFCPILEPYERRQKLFECSGLTEDEIDIDETREIDEIVESRKVCGCSCKEKGIACQRETCSCYANGIGCQQEKFKFPCSCTLKWCKNPNGMKRFDTKSVSNHLKKVLSAGKSYGEDLFNTGTIKKEVSNEVNVKKRKSSPRRKYTNKRKKKTEVIVTTTPNSEDQDLLSSISKSLRSNSKRVASSKIEKNEPITKSEIPSFSPLVPNMLELEQQKEQQAVSPSSSQSSIFSQEPISVNLINQL